MIIYRISGPKDAVAKAASKLHSLHQVEGKVVRRYEAAAVESIGDLPKDADVVIITEYDEEAKKDDNAAIAD